MDICQSIVSWIRKYIKLIDKCFTFGFFVPDYIYTKIMKCQDFNDTSDKNIDLTLYIFKRIELYHWIDSYSFWKNAELKEWP